jgi:uncharacterized protein (TIGR02270 family)
MSLPNRLRVIFAVLPTMIIVDILEEHFEEAEFLWQQRENLLWSRVSTLDALADLEERLLAHVDGLVLGDEEAWALLEPKLFAGQQGEVFVAAIAALESANPARIQLVRDALAGAEEDILDGICHALRHTSCPDVENLVSPLLSSEAGAVRAAAIDVLSFRRISPATELLQAGLKAQDPLVVAAAARAAGRIRTVELKYALEPTWENPSPLVRLEAIRAGLLSGNEKAIGRCRTSVLGRNEEAGEATILLGLAGHQQDVPVLVDALGAASLIRGAIVSLGYLGYVAAMDALIRCAADPELARPAGQAVQTLVGVNLEKENLALKGKAAAAGTAVEADDGDEWQIDPDEDLPIPDPEKLKEWWRKNSSRFDTNTRYRHGRPCGLQGLIADLHTGTLAARHHTALEIAMIDPSRPLLETHAFAVRQRREMAASS